MSQLLHLRRTSALPHPGTGTPPQNTFTVPYDEQTLFTIATPANALAWIDLVTPAYASYRDTATVGGVTRFTFAEDLTMQGRGIEQDIFSWAPEDTGSGALFNLKKAHLVLRDMAIINGLSQVSMFMSMTMHNRLIMPGDTAIHNGRQTMLYISEAASPNGSGTTADRMGFYLSNGSTQRPFIEASPGDGNGKTESPTDNGDFYVDGSDATQSAVKSLTVTLDLNGTATDGSIRYVIDDDYAGSAVQSLTFDEASPRAFNTFDSAFAIVGNSRDYDQTGANAADPLQKKLRSMFMYEGILTQADIASLHAAYTP